MFTAYQDRIEITSLGHMPPNQTKEGFFSGVSIPVNQKLSEILLQLHISEKSGRGVPKIIEAYGKEVFDFRDNAIVVTIPFNRLDLGEKKPSVPQVKNGNQRDNLGNPQDNLGNSQNLDSIVSVDGRRLGVAEIQDLIISFCVEPKSMADIAVYLSYKDRKTVHRYLDPLIEEGRIAMTVPDKPNSRNQRYVAIK